MSHPTPGEVRFVHAVLHWGMMTGMSCCNALLRPLLRGAVRDAGSCAVDRAVLCCVLGTWLCHNAPLCGRSSTRLACAGGCCYASGTAPVQQERPMWLPRLPPNVWLVWSREELELLDPLWRADLACPYGEKPGAKSTIASLFKFAAARNRHRTNDIPRRLSAHRAGLAAALRRERLCWRSAGEAGLKIWG